MNSQVQPNASIAIPPTPAIDLKLSGLHLIEASAGTGKTWTLSTLMVRLIVEGEYLTRQIIATTFTRAAAAELKLRIRKRFEEFRSLFHEAMFEHAAVLQRMHAQEDWLAVYLLQTLDLEQILHGKNRLQLALDSFDELFVGTLDSFCQKLLNEFAFDSGQHEILQISEQEAEACYQVMHDALRQWRSQQSPQLIEFLVLTDQLKQVEDYRGSITTVLNFLSAQLQPAELPVFEWDNYQAVYQQAAALNEQQLAAFDAFFAADGCYHQSLHGSKCFKKHGTLLKPLLQSIAQNDLSYLLQLHEHKKYADLLDGFLAIDGMFNKKPADQLALQQFHALEGVAVIQQLAQLRQLLSQQLEQVSQHLHYYLSHTVRQQLPQILSERGETTFSQQMRVLGDVLQHDSSQILARHIQHRYPVALVDEFQDTNFDQDRVIAHIWRQPVEPVNPHSLRQDNVLLNSGSLGQDDVLLNPRLLGQGSALLNPHELEHSSRLTLGQSNALLSPRSCLVLVGDPKQAIYGFRGGDMLTYQRARQHVLQLGGQQHFLRFNHRSVAPLVAAVDRLFRFNTDFGEAVTYQPVEAGGRNSTELCEGEKVNHWPLRLIEVEAQKTEFEQVAWQIIQLLQASQTATLVIRQGEQSQPLNPSDIAVLCRSNTQLDKVQAVLQQAQIPVWRSSRVSIFQTSLAEDIVALLQVMLSPYHEGRLRRALAGVLIGKSLKQLMQLDQQPDQLADLQALFFNWGERWYKAGFLAAWQQLAEYFEIWANLSRQPQAERLVVNLRHLVEVIHQYSEKIQGQHHLLAWLMRQVSQPGQREWELERRLSGEQGVQLMTIHKSKGLEFPVVFVAGLDRSKAPQKSSIIFYEHQQQRMLSFSDQDAAQRQAHEERENAELRRLIYVALTRASLRLYITAPPLADSKGKLKGALYHWLPATREEWTDTHTALESGLPACPDFVYRQQQPHAAIEARPVPQHRVYPWGLTSFSQLSRHQHASFIPLHDAEQTAPDADLLLHRDENSPAGTDSESLYSASTHATLASPSAESNKVNNKKTSVVENLNTEQSDAEILAVETIDTDTSDAKKSDVDKPDIELPLCFRFPRGANAGDCLHHILEQMNPQQPMQWPRLFEKHLQNFAINAQLSRYKQPEIEIEQLADWFEQILHAPLPDGATLAGLVNPIHEFEFHLSVADRPLNIKAIHDLLQQHQVPVAPLNPVLNARYLHGFIDLVYEHQGKFYIADYKSNYLGDDYACYSVDILRQNMSHSSYWLQAVLYQLALHRFLKLRLPNYQPQQHLGGAVYLYLRGMHTQQADSGVLHWQASVALLTALDELLGQHDE